MNIQEKIKELQNVSCIGIKEKKLDFYSKFFEFELDNGEFILINDYLYCGTKLNQGECVDEGWCVYKESVIDRISSDNSDDEFWENCDKYYSDDFKLYIYDRIDTEENIVVEVFNQYIDVIKYCFDVYNATEDFSE